MKTTLIFIFSLFVCCSIKAQIKTKVFKLDASNPHEGALTGSDNSKRLTFWSRQPLQFEVINANPFRYNYAINSKFLNFFENKDNNPFETLKEKLDSAATPQTEDDPKEAITEAEALEQKLKKDKTALSQTDKNKAVKILSTNAFLNLPKPDLADKQKVINSLSRFITAAKQDTAYKMKASATYYYLTRNVGMNVPEPATEKDEINNIIDALDEIDKAASALLEEVTQYGNKIKSVDHMDKDDFILNRDKFNSKAIGIANVFLAVKKDAGKFGTIGEEYKSREATYKDTIKKLLDAIGQFNGVHLENYIMPIDVNGKNIDVVEISFERYEKENPTEIQKNIYNIWVKGGLKIDISGGIFITSLVNYEYITENRTITVDDEEVQRKIIRKKEKGNYEFGFGSMINISHRSGGWANPTLNIGALFTTNQQFQLLSGLGLILGKEERIILTGGCSLGRVARISEAYKDDGETLYDLGASGVVPTSNQFDFGYFFGVTYNLSKSKKQTD